MAKSAQEAQWVLRAQCGDAEALELLLRSIQPALRRYIRGLVGASHADDVLQEVLLIMYRKLRLVHTPELFRPWAYRIASRSAFRHLRSVRRWPEQLEEEFDVQEVPLTLTPFPTAERLQELLNLDSISLASRAVLELHFQEELSLPQIAAILEIPLGTVKSRLAYGLSAIRKELTRRKEKK